MLLSELTNQIDRKWGKAESYAMARIQPVLPPTLFHNLSRWKPRSVDYKKQKRKKTKNGSKEAQLSRVFMRRLVFRSHRECLPKIGLSQI